jgi:hypothetical protein
MGEILGLGITHYPALAYKGNLSRRINQCLADPALPERLRSPENWPADMRKQWANDEGEAHSTEHRQAMIDEFRKARAELDAFNPDVVVIWGDDQYENYEEDCVPPFSILAYEQVELHPWQHNHGRGQNSWDEPEDTTVKVRGHREAGKYFASSLLHDGIDVAYSYKPLHADGYGHAHTNSVLYMDWDRRGFPYPLLAITVNAYGRHLVQHQGTPLTPSGWIEAAAAAEEDPPGPQPWRCFQLGASVARAAAKSPWKVALIASSSWSHSFLVEKHAGFYPDVESDRRFFDALVEGDWKLWSEVQIEEAEDRGHHELLNWFCLVGAMAEIDRRPDYAVFLESWITNSDKVFAAFHP